MVASSQMTKTDVAGVYRRGDKYVYTYRKRGKQRWGTARTKAEARRLKRNAETDVERGQHRDLSRATFGEYARDWIEHYGGRTSSGVRESTRRWYRQMLEDRLIPYFDQERGLRLAEIEPRDVKALVAWLAQQPNPHDPARTLGGRRSATTSPFCEPCSRMPSKKAFCGRVRQLACGSRCRAPTRGTSRLRR